MAGNHTIEKVDLTRMKASWKLQRDKTCQNYLGPQ